MHSWLYLPPEALTAEAQDTPVVFWSAGQTPVSSTLSQAAVAFEGRRVSLILPMERCSWLLTDAWPGRRRPDAQTLAFAIEEQLADDLEQLHVACGVADAQRRYPLLIIHKDYLQAVLARLREAGLWIDRTYADADLLPRDQACAAWWAGRWIIGGALEARLALPAQALESIKPRLPGTVHWLDDSECLPALFHTASEQAINLLQGDFKVPVRRLPLGALAVSLVSVFALALGFSHSRSDFLEQEAERLNALSEQHFKQLYPEQPRVNDLLVQLNALQQVAPRAQGPMARLAQLSEQVIGASSVEVQRMEWRAGSGWMLQISANSFAELEHLRERAERSALGLALGSASQQGKRVQAQLTLEEVL